LPAEEVRNATRPSSVTGRKGEDRAVGYLASQGCNIVARNWQAHPGEIDIIVECGDERDGVEPTVAFVEVRTRHGREGLAEESISARKAASMVSAAYSYMEAHGIDPEVRRWRIDLVSIALEGNRSSIHWIKNAIGEDML
jgi:putative endonuclease